MHDHDCHVRPAYDDVRGAPYKCFVDDGKVTASEECVIRGILLRMTAPDLSLTKKWF
jgi:hypothetical protein